MCVCGDKLLISKGKFARIKHFPGNTKQTIHYIIKKTKIRTHISNNIYKVGNIYKAVLRK